METTPQQPVNLSPRIPAGKYKTFTYHTNLQWTSERQGMLRADGKPEIVIASPPEFKGIPGVWTPEDFFVASVEMCQMTTFLAFGIRKELPLRSYKSAAEGTLEFVDGNYRFTKIIIRPEMTVGNGWAKEQVEQLVHSAHDHCLIGNSITAEVIVEPKIFIL